LGQLAVCKNSKRKKRTIKGQGATIQATNTPISKKVHTSKGGKSTSKGGGSISKGGNGSSKERNNTYKQERKLVDTNIQTQLHKPRPRRKINQPTTFNKADVKQLHLTR